MMRYRRTYLLVIAVGGFVGLLVALCRREQEPEYHGKKLSEWIDFRHQQQQKGVTVSLKPEAEEAVRRIGTNGIPFLIEWMSYETPRWQTGLYGLLNPMVHDIIYRLNGRSWQPPGRAERARAEGAMHALKTLAIVGHPTNPEVSRILNDPRARFSWLRAATVLAECGTNGLPALLSAMTNSHRTLEERMSIYWCLGTNGAIAVPVLLHALGESNLTSRIFATNALEEALHEMDNNALPILVPMLTNKDYRFLRYAALDRVSQLGTNAQNAVPALLRCLGDDDELVSVIACDALEALNLDGSFLVPSLTNCLAYANATGRVCIVGLLGRLGRKDGSAVSLLRKLLQDDEPRVRSEATNALRRIESRAPEESAN